MAVSLGSERANVLIVDDQPVNLDALEEILRITGYRIWRANSGEEALRLLLENEYACCLLDIRMPGIDGFETAGIIRQDAQLENLPIIFVTAEAKDRKDVFRGYEKGAVDFLIKPLEPIAVRSKVRTFGELFLQKLALREAHRDLEHFSQVAAHDLREPLRKQRNLLDLLREDLALAQRPEAGELFARIWASSEQMLGLIDGIRILSGIGCETLQRESVDLKQVIERCLEGWWDQLRERNAQVQFDSFPREANVYRPLITSLYNNLVGNVLDHALGNGFEIRFTAENSRSGWVFGVRNTGSAISANRLNDVFKVFRKADGARTDGRGIGLSVCKKIVDRHHGRIFANSGDDYTHIQFALGERTA